MDPSIGKFTPFDRIEDEDDGGPLSTLVANSGVMRGDITMSKIATILASGLIASIGSFSAQVLPK